jgi:HAD superfamily hydrolase (TIGR01509 family)
MASDERRPAAIIDVDGTLVDTNYQHALAWYRAFRQHGVTLPLWEIHRHVGMGGDQLVTDMVGSGFDAEHGDDVRAAERALYLSMMPEVQPFQGARELLQTLRAGGHTIVLASSAKPDELQHYLSLLDAHEVADGWTDSGDVEQTKPEPDLVSVAVEKAGGGPAVMIGDSTWDCQAAGNAGLETIGVLTGGFSEQELRDAGAAAVFRSLPELAAGLDRTPLRS